MDVVDVLQGLKEDGTVLLNSAHALEGCGATCRHVDLTGIALAKNLVIAGSPILNTPVLGALAKMASSRSRRSRRRSGRCLPTSGTYKLLKRHMRS